MIEVVWGTYLRLQAAAPPHVESGAHTNEIKKLGKRELKGIQKAIEKGRQIPRGCCRTERSGCAAWAAATCRHHAAGSTGRHQKAPFEISITIATLLPTAQINAARAARCFLVSGGSAHLFAAARTLTRPNDLFIRDI